MEGPGGTDLVDHGKVRAMVFLSDSPHAICFRLEAT